MKVKVCLDTEGYDRKRDDLAGVITLRIVKNEKELEIKELAEHVCLQGYAFTPATFGKKSRTINDFVEMQVFPLDFDTGISFEEIKARADEYHLPISFAYHSFNSSPQLEKFRIVFVHDGLINDSGIAKLIYEMLSVIFPERDPSCIEVSRFFYGGKDLIWLDENALIDISTLEREYACYLYEHDKKHSCEKMRRLAKTYRVKMDDKGSMAIYNSDMVDEPDKSDGDFVPYSSTYYIYGTKSRNYYVMREDSISSVSGIDDIDSGRNTKEKKKDRHKKYRNVDFDAEKVSCRLFRRMMNDEVLHHQEYYLLMLNLIQVEGGEKLFLNKVGIHKDISKWEFYVLYAKKKTYHACTCDRRCPYANECTHGYNMIETIFGKIISENSIDYYKMSDAQKQLENNFQKAIYAKGTDMHLIKAQTAMGKSSIYIRVTKKMKVPCIIAVSTNKLKNEIYGKLKDNCKLPVAMTPSLDEMELMEFPDDVIQEIKAAYRRGCMEETSTILKKYRKIWEKSKNNLDQIYIQNCDYYLEFNKEYLEKGGYHIVTTHAKLLTIKQDQLWKFGCVIIDEDILFSLMKDTFRVRRKDIEKLKNHVNPDLKHEFDKILAAEEGTCGLIQYKGIPRTMKMEELNRYAIKSNVNALLQSKSYYISEKDSDVICFAPRKLCSECKYIILSATLNEWMYEQYFRKVKIIRYPTKDARYKGDLIQFCNYSLSRTSLAQRENDIFEAVKYICPDNIPVISFKDKEKNEHSLHFGNSEGVNVLEGQDIAVVGTPHYPDYVYKLAALVLDPKCNCDEKIQRRRVTSGGFRFTMNSFKDTTIREVQLYLIRSELEQCIGRARILRHSCTVFLFSSFPCSQAQLIQSNYLLKENLERYRAKFHSKE